VPDATHLLKIYQGRMRSNLIHALRPLVGSRAPEVSSRIAALIDGVYLRQSLVKSVPDESDAARQVLEYVGFELEGAVQ
jgi:TetR/AcrR family transcriptional repressor of bet genes